MLSVYGLKPAFQNLLRPLTSFLARVGVTANHVTITAFVLSYVVGYFLAHHGTRWMFLLLPVVFFIRMALNAIDGMLAREHNMKTRLGAFLNELGDVCSDTVLYLPFAYVTGITVHVLIFLVILSIISEMTGVLAQAICGTRRYDGPMGKSDRAVCFSIMAIVSVMWQDNAIWYINAALLYILSPLLLITIYNRIAKALKEQLV